MPFDQATKFVGCAGAFTTIAAIAQHLPTYDPERIYMLEISFERMREVTTDLRLKTAAQRLEDPVMHPGRADVIGSVAFADAAGVSSFIISEKDILDGIVAKLVAQ
ncbi:hypothetical protein HMPREF3104_02825 [Corynebacterium sp. HMSC30G07]|uniref:hypothetical protein n=1 Tax=Corynebacterium sp. HMSC30G07 TaxID=1581072 RepID=UPI0008A30F52|nr:hypothetical protein [Corynebacterium sp. HMSC30G07]OFT77196.1 hypothetical protein HMPREF3104_02825 [Corynebacterium sp. HMSC30G07]